MKGKLEVIIIGIFALIFLVWAVNKCTSGKEKLSEATSAEAKEDSLAAVVKPSAQSSLPPLPLNPGAAAGQPAANPAQAGQPSTAPIAAPAAGTGTATPGAPGATAAKPAEAPKETQLSKLYVTIDKLKLRKTPGLKGESLGELKLFDEVYFMNEITDSTTELSLGKEIVNEPWVKVKTKKGTVGWVYGAGVHYHKKKRSGTIE